MMPSFQRTGWGKDLSSILSGFYGMVNLSSLAPRKRASLSGGYPPAQVERRHLVNTWLWEQGRLWFDAIFDFATPLASPDDGAVLHPAYDSGDGVHPNDDSYR